MKQCRKCKKLLQETGFHKHVGFQDGLRSDCIQCYREYSKQWRKKNRTKLLSKNKIRYMTKVQDENLQKLYGLKPGEYQDMFLKQGGLCALCRTAPNKRLHVDHDHLTGRVRGLLCCSCNLGIGFFKDSCDRLILAVEYLQNK